MTCRIEIEVRQILWCSHPFNIAWSEQIYADIMNLFCATADSRLGGFGRSAVRVLDNSVIGRVGIYGQLT